jgi:hypothetical protein
MTIDIAIALIASSFSATTLLAILHERRCDVLHGPYIEGRRPRRPIAGLADRLDRAIRASGLRDFLDELGWKARNFSCFASAIIC